MKNELRVLLVEDVILDAELIAHELQKAGIAHRSRRVESRQEFLHELGRHKPDLILSDHGMPAFDGFAALDLARERCPEVPFIFVTGAHGDEVAAETIKRGAEDYVLKSHLHQLVPAIQRALARRQERAPQSQNEAAVAPGSEGERLGGVVRQRTAQLAADHRELEDFAAGIARELRTPVRHLECLLGRLQKAATDKLDHQGRASVETLVETSRQIARLTDELFTFIRIDQAQMYVMPFDLAEVAREVVQELGRQAEGREIEWVAGELPEVRGDPALLGLALTNLISNALKFTRTRRRARIEIGSQMTDREAIIFVADNGIGFDPRSMDKLFGVFQRLPTARDFEGLGVGLANVRRIVQRHGGRTWAEGGLDEGATVYFSLPRSAKESPTRS